jgi:hypothetical protein
VQPSRSLIYSTPETWSEADQWPLLRDHLGRFRAVMDARRETRLGVRPWWQLHWPRDEALWQQPKIVALQMAARPAFAHSAGPIYCPFSANVFVPHRGTREDRRWFAALLNSRLMWSWFRRHAKRRGIGLEINGHVLARAPVRTVDFADPAQRVRHDRIVELAEEMAAIARRLRQAADGRRARLLERQSRVDRKIDDAVYELYGLSDGEVKTVETGLGIGV